MSRRVAVFGNFLESGRLRVKPTATGNRLSRMNHNSDIKGSFSFVSLGCPKNTVDSERMLGLLSGDGYVLVPEAERTDFVIVNTCGFIESARQESLAVIREMIDRKKSGRTRGVVVAGCLAERQKEMLLEEVPEVDQIVGVFGREEIVKAAERIVGKLEEQRSLFRPAAVRAQDDRARLRITPRHLAYLKVSEGCDRLCTFCSIPLMRGKHVSKPIEAIVEEARELASDGVRELNLVAQDMTYYGLDLYGRPRLADLIAALDEIEGIDWIRVLYNYPMHVDDRLIAALADSRKVVPYLDMPLQHINDRILRLMNRRHSRAETENILTRLRAGIPNLVLRTTFIVGFPGETESEFVELEEFVKATRFERLGVFNFSDEPDTPSRKLSGHLPDEVKNERRARLMLAQEPIAFAFNRSLVGRTLDVLIDSSAEEQGRTVWIGRTYADAPDIDGVTLVRGRDLQIGDIVSCEIVDAQGHDTAARATTARPRRKLRERPSARKKPSSALRILQ